MDYGPAPSWTNAYEPKLYRGHLIEAVEIRADAAVQDLINMQDGLEPFSQERAVAAVYSRHVLRAASLLDGWAVQLARWILEAANAGRAQMGPASELLEACAPSLNPPVPDLLAYVRAHGHASRANVTRAIGQCASHHDLWAALAARTVAATGVQRPAGSGAANGIDEHNRLYWTPLHYAAAYGSVDVMDAVLALRPSNVSAVNGVGLSPLHVAVAHDSLATAAILGALPHTTEMRDRAGRTPSDLAVEVAPSAARCRAMLAALGHVATGVLTRQAKKACASAAAYRKERTAQGTIGPLPAPCAGGGGWKDVGEGRRDVSADADDDDDDDYDDDNESGGRAGEHRHCELPVIGNIRGIDLTFDYLAAGMPVVVSAGVSSTHPLYAKWRLANFLNTHRDVVISPEPYPYAHASAKLYNVHPDNSTTVADMLLRPDDRSAAAGERRKHGVFNALHGFKRIRYRGDGTEQRTVHGDIALTSTSPDELPPSSPRRLLHDFERPAFLHDDQWVLRTESIQFYLGGSASGAQPHWHAASWNWLVHGSKRWFVWPPSQALYSQDHVERTVGPQDKDFARPTKKGKGPKGTAKQRALLGKALVCDQRPGEVVILPESWGHATTNLERSIGWASEFHFDRMMDDGLSSTHGPEWWRAGERREVSALARPYDVEETAPTEPEREHMRMPMGVYGT